MQSSAGSKLSKITNLINSLIKI